MQFAGYKEGGLGRDKSLIRCQELVTILRPLMQAKAALAFTDDTLYAVLTLGAAVSRKLDEYEKDGDVMDSLLFNALADTCLMALEEEVLQQLQLICKQKGCGITGRHEPGSDIPLSSQADAVAETKAGQSLGVSVNKDLVLSPAKSMTLVFDIGSDPKVFHAAHDCASCPKTDCDRRKDSGEAVVTVPAGVKVDEAIQAQGTDLSMPCGGKGRCGKCRVRVVAGKLAVTPADRNVFPTVNCAKAGDWPVRLKRRKKRRSPCPFANSRAFQPWPFKKMRNKIRLCWPTMAAASPSTSERRPSPQPRRPDRRPYRGHGDDGKPAALLWCRRHQPYRCRQ